MPSRNTRSTHSPESKAYFCPGGVPAAVGALVLTKPLAATFRLIASNGPDGFYKYRPGIGCDIAKGIIEGVAGTPAAPWVAVADAVNGPGETPTHCSVVDRHGNRVSSTNTIESWHGIGVFAS